MKSFIVFEGTCGETTHTNGCDATIETGVRSFCGSNGRFGRTATANEMWPLLPRHIVYPSGADCFATVVTPGMPPAPPRLSTTTVWPQAS